MLYMLPTHWAGAQTVSAAYRLQAPAPLHIPVGPQLVAGVATQTLRGSVPAATGAQVPTEPERLQVVQRPVHAVLQQTPSTQKPLAHSPVAEQLPPFGLVAGRRAAQRMAASVNLPPVPLI